MLNISNPIAHVRIKKGRPWPCCTEVSDMTEKATVCTASGVPLVERGSTSFPCPGCGEVSIGRSPRCRNQGVAYVCECGFQGP